MTLSNRATCYRCLRPRVVCYCDALVRIRPRTRVVIVQHPREHRHPLNTARIVERAVQGSSLVTAGPAELGAALDALALPPETALLYPSAEAELLEELPERSLPPAVIVVDGTWHHAKTLLRDVPALRRYRPVRFVPTHPSNYRIRKEPREDYLSTVESVHHVLSRLEPETPGLDALLSCFDTMVDRNLSARRPSASGERFRTRSSERPHHFPDELATPLHRTNVVYAEGTSRFAEREAQRVGRRGKEPLVVVLGPAAGEGALMTRWCQTEARVPDRLLQHLGISRQRLGELARPPGEVADEVAEGLEGGQLLTAWNASTFRILADLGLRVAPSLLLKSTYCDHQVYLASRGRGPLPAAWGEMDDILHRHNLPAPGPSGRAEKRWKQSLVLFRWLKALRDTNCGDDES